MNRKAAEDGWDDSDDDDTFDETDTDFSESEEEEAPLTEEQLLEQHRRRYVGRLYNGQRHPEYFQPRPGRLSLPQLCAQYQEEGRALRRRLEAEGDSADATPGDGDLDIILRRFDMKLNRGHVLSFGDPNQAPFPLPHDVAPSSTQSWIGNWEPFDFVLQPWPCIETEPAELGDPHQVFAGTLRPWLDQWVPFHSGDTKRTELAPDLITRDILTKKQRRLWEQRANRKNFFSPGRMQRRREQLKQYFQTKYHKTDKDMKKYSHFTESLQEGMAKFAALCDDNNHLF